MTRVDPRLAWLQGVSHERGGGHRRQNGLHMARLDSREVEQVGDEPFEPGRIFAAHRENLAFALGGRRGELLLHKVDPHLQCRERCS